MIRDAVDAEACRLTYWRAMREVCADLRAAGRDGFVWPEWWAARRGTLAYDFAQWREARDWQRAQQQDHRRAA